jgi:tetratricopeptide (TPR) repeat protein
MNTVNRSYLDTNQIIKRFPFVTMVKTAINVGQEQFARQACLSWLANFPGDLGVSLLYAKSLAKLGEIELAITILDKITTVDPEYVDALDCLASFSSDTSEMKSQLKDIVSYLKQDTQPSSSTQWVTSMTSAKEAFLQGNNEIAEKFILDALTYNPFSSLPYILHLQIVQKKNIPSLTHTLATIYSAKWPDTANIKVLSALLQLEEGNESSAVENLHWCAVHDTTGQVISKMLGDQHRFKPLWPEVLQIYLDIPVPAQVASQLGWNRLGDGVIIGNHILKEAAKQSNFNEISIGDIEAGNLQKSIQSENIMSQTEEKLQTKSPSPTNPEQKMETDLDEIQKQFDRIAKKVRRKTLSNTDTRFPIYVILSSRTALIAKYGENTMAVIDQLLKELSGKIQQSANWNSIVFFPDDPGCTNSLGISPIINNDPWKVKLLLSDLDKHLNKHGEMIGALLIIGGDDIIPFHQLPNPTDDMDKFVLSDNPYATLDENYFLSQWPVGRIPDEKGSDAGFLIEQIRFLNNEYGFKAKSKSFSPFKIFAWISELFSSLLGITELHVPTNDSVGYSAEVWETTSALVYDTISSAKKLITCPPITSKNISQTRQNAKKCGYYNLHGLQDGPDWYGQRDPLKKSSELDYPIAITPTQLGTGISSAEVIFSEACYGAYTIDKSTEESMALKFLSSGSRCMIGSTGIAYGSVVKPLIAADLLASEFWKQILGGISVGYALMRAKINLVQLMVKKQGYLDGEDQKTILSFILYGDPLAVLIDFTSVAKPLSRVKTLPEIKVVNDFGEELTVEESGLSEEILSEVKSVVSKYLPGLQNGEYSVNSQQSYFKIADPSRKSTQTPDKSNKDQHYVITLKKSIAQDNVNHQSYARMTLDHKGKIIKLALSR